MTQACGPSRADRSHVWTLHLRIVNIANEQVKVSLALPVSLVAVAQRLGARLLPPDTSIEMVVTLAQQEGVAQLAWVDPAHGERLELTVD